MEIQETENAVKVVLDLRTIGYIARAKREEDHAPSFFSQHAECIRPFGELIGFTGRGGPASGGNWCASWNLIDMNVQGATYEVQELINHAEKNPVQRVRDEAKKMIYADDAQKANYMSAVLIIQTPTETIARNFVRAWENLKDNPKSFNIVGGNCAIRAQNVFVESGIYKGKKHF